MALTPEQVAAYEHLEDALDALEQALDGPQAGEFITGWVLVINGSAFVDPERPGDDEQDMMSTFRAYVKRGQLPALTRGILECYLDKFREPQDDG